MKIDFEITQGSYTYKDAILLPDDRTYTEAEINAIKQTRFANWYAIVTGPPVEYLLNENGDYVLDEYGNPISVTPLE